MFTTPSIILRSRDVGEADRIYTFYTRDHGKIEALATGVRKIKSKLAGHCLLYTVIRATFFPGRERMRLVAAVAERSYHFITVDSAACAVSGYAAEACDTMTKSGITDAALFHVLVRLFEGLQKKSASPMLLLHAFLFHFLSALGYRPSPSVLAKTDALPLLLKEHLAEPLHSEQFLRFASGVHL